MYVRTGSIYRPAHVRNNSCDYVYIYTCQCSIDHNVANMHQHVIGVLSLEYSTVSSAREGKTTLSIIIVPEMNEVRYTCTVYM